ncbi:MAG: DUF2155 domain-containing protein [Alphaproteobacteria bacterium]|nr:DUF2155 domain-containing protein [Alphaproteobacteria bacterium]
MVFFLWIMPTQKVQAEEEVALQIAVFSGLDKITARISTFEAMVGKAVRFGTLQVVAHVCYRPPPTLAQQVTAFVTVDEVGLSDKVKRAFSGWMFSESPGLHGLEHPAFDVWLIDCKTSSMGG